MSLGKKGYPTSRKAYSVAKIMRILTQTCFENHHRQSMR